MYLFLNGLIEYLIYGSLLFTTYRLLITVGSIAAILIPHYLLILA